MLKAQEETAQRRLQNLSREIRKASSMQRSHQWRLLKTQMSCELSECFPKSTHQLI